MNKHTVTCTGSKNYSVTDSEGKLKAGYSIEMFILFYIVIFNINICITFIYNCRMIRHKHLNISTVVHDLGDKFRIQIFDLNRKFSG